MASCDPWTWYLAYALIIPIALLSCYSIATNGIMRRRRRVPRLLDDAAEHSVKLMLFRFFSTSCVVLAVFLHYNFGNTGNRRTMESILQPLSREIEVCGVLRWSLVAIGLVLLGHPLVALVLLPVYLGVW